MATNARAHLVGDRTYSRSFRQAEQWGDMLLKLREQSGNILKYLEYVPEFILLT